MTKLSVITINYNNKDGLKKTIESIVSQTYSDLEFIIIDGGSIDGSADVIKNYSDKIRYWVSEKDSGIYNAQNKGIKAAGGEYCLFLNSGDYLVDENVLKNVFSKKFTEDIIYGDMMVDWGSGKITLEKMHKRIGLYEMYTDTVWHPVSFIKRIIFEEFGGYDESYKIVADYEFFFKTIIVKKISTLHIPIPIAVFAFNGLSSRPENKREEQEERQRVWKTYLSEQEIESLENKLQSEIAKKKTLFSRIIKKLKL